jgi:protein phosphatase
LFVDLDLGLLVVADGMGGHNAGEVASRMAVDAVVDFIRATQKGGEITWPFPLNPAQSMSVNRVEVALRVANQRVHAAGERDPERAGMGTTIVAVLVEDDHIVIGHVGDSRAYVFRRGELRQITEDHTWLNAIGNGHPEVQDHPLRHVLTNGIGMGADLTPSVAEERLSAGERWLMCTDGVHGYLDREALCSVMTLASAEAAASEAVRRAVSAGTTDNATAVVLNVD